MGYLRGHNIVSLWLNQQYFLVFFLVLIKTAFDTFLPVFSSFCMPVRVSLCVTHPLTQL